MINYLFSRIEKFTTTQKKYILKNIKSGMNIVYIASMPDNYERTNEQVEGYTDTFSKIGIVFNNVFSLDGRNTKKESESIIKNSDIVFLTGGSPELQMKFINEYKLAGLIKSSKIVIGVSAGAMNQGSRVVYKDDFDNYKIKDYKGLNLTDINVFPHYDINNKECIKEVEEVSKINSIICLPDKSFIYIENGDTQILGKHKTR